MSPDDFKMYDNKAVDSFTGVTVSEQTYQIAKAMKAAFIYIESKKL